MYERRKSVFDTISQMQCDAWEANNKACREANQGHTLGARYWAEVGATLTEQDIHNKIMEIFDRADMGNEVLDTILRMKTEKGIYVMKPGIDYTLIEQ